MFDVIKHISRSLCKTVKVGLYIYIFVIYLEVQTRVRTYSHSLCAVDKMMVSKCNVYLHVTRKREKKLKAQKSLLQCVRQKIFVIFSWTHTDTYAHHTFTYFIRNLLKENVKKSKLCLKREVNAWKDLKKKPSDGDGLWEKSYRVREHLFYVCKNGQTHTHTQRTWWADVNDSLFCALFPWQKMRLGWRTSFNKVW